MPGSDVPCAEEGWVPPDDLPPEPQWRTWEHVRCLECGQWKVVLGKHLSAEHALDSAGYRERWGMRSGMPLCSLALSEKMRGVAVSRGAENTDRLVAMAAENHVAATEATKRREMRPQELQARGARSEARARAREAAARILVGDLERWVREKYVDGLWSIRDMMRYLDLSEKSVRAVMASAGIEPRRRGPATRLPQN
ncbi:MucR family transcriptional regulator [Nocardia sp. alder85J]|uniref:MucR family transcriptional regulator n=1 Tax=Nocardia sp. alder85J TaxID=2862949 RepID=UPI001CD34366|nr:MucR family transcriptional regulator [Nocardia sp. alder85J]MCX4099108.1 MucR family transcriptional regulator [Nocardia sp. alder85J]